ncbi:unnamed protein product [Linum tenue]|uniref:Uncharacterized protein n=1 Tax=Linum tenue TaxID=586396 RepID=A0AAV0L6V1_9ROSI|nr:unnamed protein product [Linum tenue]
MATEPNPASFLLLLYSSCCRRYSPPARNSTITDDLRDVVDDEEDEAWKEWGKKKTSDVFDPPPSDMSGMELEQIQEAFMKRTMGPRFRVRQAPTRRQTVLRIRWRISLGNGPKC